MADTAAVNKGGSSNSDLLVLNTKLYEAADRDDYHCTTGTKTDNVPVLEEYLIEASSHVSKQIKHVKMRIQSGDGSRRGSQNNAYVSGE